MATNCYVLIRVPLTDAHKPETSSAGHYGLQVNKSNFSFATKTFGSSSSAKTTRTYTNPVFSYGGDGLSIFEASDLDIPTDNLLCKYHFTSDDTEIETLIDWLEANCEYDASQSTSSTHVYQIMNSKFSSYQIEYSNCFAVAALLCDKLGYSGLQNIYNANSYPNGSLDSDGYKNYYAWPMFLAHHRAWIFDKLKI